jgi:hypothetical protein
MLQGYLNKTKARALSTGLCSEDIGLLDGLLLKANSQLVIEGL